MIAACVDDNYMNGSPDSLRAVTTRRPEVTTKIHIRR